MKDCLQPTPCLLLAVALALSCAGAVLPSPARADVFGRLRVRLQPTQGRMFPTAAGKTRTLPGAQVTLRDTADVRGDVTLTTGRDGTILSPLLEDRDWRIVRVALPGTAAPTRIPCVSVRVVPDTTTDVTITVDPARNAVVAITDGDGTQTAIVYRSDRAFIQRYPSGNGKPQSLGRVLQTVPGIAR